VRALVEGLILGWSVAWPPGPINAEMMRRALERGFVAAWLVGLGAASGDFLWAALIGGGAGVLARSAAIERVLAIVGAVVLGTLAVFALRTAFRVRAAVSTPVPRNGYWFGLTLSLTSPWNFAFWVGVAGTVARDVGPLGVFLRAAAVIAGAISWSTIFSAISSLFARIATRTWTVVANVLTAIVLLVFAVRSLLHAF
jgi:threonine/homoserine/homoserine lactone efflux protein